MRSRAFGDTGAQLSAIGLGTWALAGQDWCVSYGQQDEDLSVGVIRSAADAGINWIDTAPIYGYGRAEELIKRALTDIPAADRPFIFTKCGLTVPRNGEEPAQVLSASVVRAECEESLQRLGVERIDLLQVHWPPDDDSELEEGWGEMAQLVDEGKVRWIGTSNFGVDQLERCQAIRQVDALQPQFSLLERDFARDVLPWCRKYGTGIISYSPLGSGLLSGSFTLDRLSRLDADDWRRRDPRFSRMAVERVLSLVEELRMVAARHDCTVPELAYAWVLAWPGVSAVLGGARTIDQVEQLSVGAALTLDPEDLDRIRGALERSGAGSGPVLPEPPGESGV